MCKMLSFRTRKTIGEYAELMYKSPKTITNVFSKYSKDSPLHVIHKRVIMEAKRMLLSTDKPAKEIGYELGYSDPAQFSKLFRKNAGMTTSEFRNTRSQILELRDGRASFDAKLDALAQLAVKLPKTGVMSLTAHSKIFWRLDTPEKI